MAAVTAFLLALGCAAPAAASPPPRLVVLIVIDQMRGDYLDRFAPIYAQDGGLEAFRRDGVRFARAFHEHAVTATAPGHATLVTGCDPAQHGMIANMIPTGEPGKFRLAAIDDRTKTVGGEGAASSSRDLLVDAIGDWLQATNPRSQVVSIALKNRSATMLGGRRPDACLWFDDKSGRYVTSEWYTATLPEFVARFDREFPAAAELGGVWTPIVPDAAFDAVGATRDDEPYEGRFGLARTDDAAFPHRLEKFGDFTFQPRGDERTLELAAFAAADLGLGTDDAPDLLCIGLSAADYVGHAYGPDSRELVDHYARLDRAIGRWMRTIATRVAQEDVLYVLTADHGVSPIVEARIARGLEAGRIPVESVIQTVDRALDREFGAADWIDGVQPDIYLDRAAVERSGAAPGVVQAAAARAAKTVPGIEDAFTREQLSRPTPVVPDPFVRSFHRERSGDVVLAFRRFWQLDYLDVVGYVKTNHSTHHEYDRHIPMYFLRGGVPARIRTERFSSVDLAPTLARALRIPIPETVDGKVHDLEPSNPR